MNKIRIGIVGLGRIGYAWEFEENRRHPCTHWGAWHNREDCKIVAVCDSDNDKKPVGDIPFYTNMEKMLTDVKCDIVSIATPPDTHADLAYKASRFDHVKIIMVEKPFCTDIEQGEQALDMAEQMGVRIAVNHSRRWDPYWKRVIDQIKAMKPWHLVGTCNRRIEDSGIHMFDLFRWLECPQHDYIQLPLDIWEGPSDGILFKLEAYAYEEYAQVDNLGACFYRFLKEEDDSLFTRGIPDKALLPRDFQGQPTAMACAVDNLVRAYKDPKLPLACTGRDGYEAWKLAAELKP